MMDFLAASAVVIRHFESRAGLHPSYTETMNMALQQGLPLGGQAIPVDWYAYLRDGPTFAHLPMRRDFNRPRLLVGFEDG
jgi:hypothetical protein